MSGSQATLLPEASVGNAPRRTRKRTPRDDAWDALVDVVGIELAPGGGVSAQVQARLGKALKELVVDGQVATPAEIQARSAEYRDRYPDSALTIEALAKHWTLLHTPHARARTAADRAVSRFEDSWKPCYDDVQVPAAPPPAPQPADGAGFSEQAWFEELVLNEQRSVALTEFRRVCPSIYRTATTDAVKHATPPHPGELLRILSAWVKNPSPYLTLYGPPGVGKTYIAVAAVRWLAQHRGRVPSIVRYGELTTRIREEWNRPRGAERSVMDAASAAGVLLLDDLGTTGDMADWEVSYVDTLFNRRLEQAIPTIITTNLRPGGSGGPGDLERHLGVRFASRLALGTAVAVGGADRRLDDR